MRSRDATRLVITKATIRKATRVSQSPVPDVKRVFRRKEEVVEEQDAHDRDGDGIHASGDNGCDHDSEQVDLAEARRCGHSVEPGDQTGAEAERGNGDE
jgi:hypothetical protein